MLPGAKESSTRRRIRKHMTVATRLKVGGVAVLALIQLLFLPLGLLLLMCFVEGSGCVNPYSLTILAVLMAVIGLSDAILLKVCIQGRPLRKKWLFYLSLPVACV